MRTLRRRRPAWRPPSFSLQVGHVDAADRGDGWSHVMGGPTRMKVLHEALRGDEGAS